MGDEVDNTQADIEIEQARTLKAIRDRALAIPIGEAGECVRCGEESKRLVLETCARCRDKYKLP